MANLVVGVDTGSKSSAISIELLTVSKEHVSAADKQLASLVLDSLAKSQSMPKIRNLRI